MSDRFQQTLITGVKTEYAKGVILDVEGVFLPIERVIHLVRKT